MPIVYITHAVYTRLIKINDINDFRICLDEELNCVYKELLKRRHIHIYPYIKNNTESLCVYDKETILDAALADFKSKIGSETDFTNILTIFSTTVDKILEQLTYHSIDANGNTNHIYFLAWVQRPVKKTPIPEIRICIQVSNTVK